MLCAVNTCVLFNIISISISIVYMYTIMHMPKHACGGRGQHLGFSSVLLPWVSGHQAYRSSTLPKEYLSEFPVTFRCSVDWACILYLG